MSKYTFLVSAAQLRAGDLVAVAEGYEPYEVLAAGYAPQGGCVAFQVLLGDDGEHIPLFRRGWGKRDIYSWSDRFYASPEAMAEIRARPSLFDLAYPELAR